MYVSYYEGTNDTRPEALLRWCAGFSRDGFGAFSPASYAACLAMTKTEFIILFLTAYETTWRPDGDDD